MVDEGLGEVGIGGGDGRMLMRSMFVSRGETRPEPAVGEAGGKRTGPAGVGGGGGKLSLSLCTAGLLNPGVGFGVSGIGGASFGVLGV